MQDILSLNGIKRYLKNSDNYNITILDSVSSTNAFLKQTAFSDNEGKVIIALSQTEGRGRFKRHFHSPENCGIYMSILLKPKIPAENAVLITAAAACAVAEAAEDLSGRKADIKWVNDVLIENKKICGILTEGSIDVNSGNLNWAVLGIGINAYLPENGYPEEIKNIAESVFDTEKEDLKNQLTANILDRFWNYYLSLEEKTFLEAYKKRSFFLGNQINVIKNDISVPAKALDIDDNCHLLVEYQNGEREYLSSGEISIKL